MRQPPAQSALRYPLNILGNRANIRTLRELCAHGGELSVAHLAIASRLTAQGVRNALAELDSADMVEPVGSGRSILYRLNRAHPLAGAMESLFRAETERVDSVIAAIKAALARPAVIAAWFYGSFARDEDGYDSDIDIALVVGGNDQGTLAETIREQLRHDGDRLAFSPSLVFLRMDDVIRLAKGDPWWLSLQADAVPIKGRRPTEVAEAARKAR